MNDTTEVQGSSAFDTIKLILALGVAVGGMVAYYMTPELPLAVRVLFVLGGLILGGLIGMTTFKGKTLWRFIQGSRVEIRKVIWPTKPDTTRTTIAVFGFTLIMGLFFWGLDTVLLLLTRMATGQA